MKKRISFWIPEEYRWLYAAIEDVQRKAEKKGVRLSQADVILSCVIPQLDEYSKVEKKQKKISSNIKKKRTVSCDNSTAWVFETIDRLVQSKNDLGISTTFSYELVRLAKNALVGSKVGSDLDKKLC